MQKIYVYYAKIPKDMGEVELYPKERADEIKGCKNENVRREKYYAWRLLEYAVKDALRLDFNNLKFTKLPSGQWICDGCCFSISHSCGVAAVAVSGGDVGVDVEVVHDIDSRIADKVLTDGELSYYKALKYEEALGYLIDTWCKKEAVFKSMGDGVFLPREIEVAEHNTRALRLDIGMWEYVIALSAKDELDIELFEGLT